jgi:hydrogenase expression/formation protein HypE
MSDERITLSHGAGGAIMAKLIEKNIVKYIGGFEAEKDIEISLLDLDDAGVIDGIIFTTDSYVVKPIFFPGGDIGSLAVAGTINDLSVMGAEPLALSLGLILEEGFLISDLDRILDSAGKVSKETGIPIITGDTKVMEKSAMDKICINTSGIGRRSKLLDANIEEVRKCRDFEGDWLKDSNLKEGDKIIISGSIGDHGITILSANTLNEWSQKSNCLIEIDEESIPIKEPVIAACEMLGIEPLNIGNEGKAVFGVVKEKVEDVLSALRKTEEGKEAAIIGEVKKGEGLVVLNTLVGGKRIVDMPIGDPVPRIC